MRPWFNQVNDHWAYTYAYDDSTSRLHYNYNYLGGGPPAEDDDTVYTSEVIYDMDVTVSNDHVGWFCTVSETSTPWLISVDLDGGGTVTEFDLSSVVGSGSVDDCSISLTNAKVKTIDSSGAVTSRAAQLVTVAYRDGDDVYWGVVEAY